jgi:hypothetical protein
MLDPRVRAQTRARPKVRQNKQKLKTVKVTMDKAMVAWNILGVVPIEVSRTMPGPK